MMKKIIYFMVCFFLMVNSTWAITLTCSEVASPGEIIQCQVEEDQYIGIKAKYQMNTGFTYQNSQINSNWKGYYTGVEGFSVGNVLHSDSFSFQFLVKVGMDMVTNQDYSIGLTDIEGTTLDYQYVLLDDVSSTIRVLSDVNTLESLKISSGTLSPSFDKNIFQYQAEVKEDHITIEAIASDSSAKIEGDVLDHSLNYGVNLFTIKVISARGNLREYTIYITRVFDKNTDSNSSSSSSTEKKKSNDITLKSLSLSVGNIDFKSDTFLYSVSVPYDIENISVEAIASSDKAIIEIQKPDVLVVGENIIKIIVTAEDGTRGTYVIIVTREKQLSHDASINNIIIKGYKIDFKADVYYYNLEINKEDKLDIDVVLNDQNASYKIKGNKDLKNNSDIQIIVTAEDGTQNIYQIHITKLNESNSSSILNFISPWVLVGFVILIFGVFIVKGWRRKIEKNVEK